MTQEQIEKESHDYALEFADEGISFEVSLGFEAGVEWALSHQWISTDDELPEDEIIFVILSEDFCGGSSSTEALFYYKRDKFMHPEGYYDACGENIPTSAIKYWMPVPKLIPKLKQDE